MANIITEADKILKLTGIDSKRFITSLYMRDSLRGEKPLYVQLENGKRNFISPNLERANIEYNEPRNIDDIFYFITYSTFSDVDENLSDEYNTMMDAIKACIPLTESITVEGDMMVSDFIQLGKNYNIEYTEEIGSNTYYVYEERPVDIKQMRSSSYENVAKKAIKLITQEENRKKIRPYLEKKIDNRFELVNQIIEKNSLDVLLVSSPLNVQEVAGIPFYEAKESYAIVRYDLNTDLIRVVTQKKLKNREVNYTTTSLSKAIGTVETDKVIGYEPEYLSVGQYQKLRLKQYTCIDICDSFRDIREKMVLIDLPYHIIASKATMYALDMAISYVKGQRTSNLRVTELDAFNKYIEFRNDFVRQMDLNLISDIYQAVTWCGNRSIYCGYATEFEIDNQCKTFRMDIGDFIMDANDGYIYAASDSCRTLCQVPEVDEVYNEFTQLMRQVISTMKPGIACKSVWKRVTSQLYKNQEKYRLYQLIPNSKKLEDIFTRNVGHAMSKQTRTTRMLTSDSEYCIEEGMVGTIEIPFGYKDIAFSVEEMWFMTNDGAINLSIG